MRVFLLVFLVQLVKSQSWIQGINAILNVNLSNFADYFIQINNKKWLIGGEPNLWCDYYYFKPSDNSMISITLHPIQSNGTDKQLGDYNSLQMTYKLLHPTNNNSKCNNLLITFMIQYFITDDFFVFTQLYPNGLPFNTQIIQYYYSPFRMNTPMIPFSEYPVFKYNDNTLLKNELGYIEWNGRFMNDHSTHGIGLSKFIGGNEGGPIVLFDSNIKKQTNALVFSTFNHFMNGIFNIRTRRMDSNNYSNYKNINFIGLNDINVIKNIQSTNDCYNLCLKYNYCNVFTYNKLFKTCHLKYNNRGIINDNNVISGIMNYNSSNVSNMNDYNYLVAGIEGNITSLPINYNLSFTISANLNSGIHGTMYKWGNILMKKYETNRLGNYKQDIVTEYLGYWTDNGGYFYGGNPLTEDIATKLFNSLKLNNIPVKYLQLDPYWYKYNASFPTKWEPSQTLFPNGLYSLYKSIGNIPLLLYSNMWSPPNSNGVSTQSYYNSNYNMSLQFTNGIPGHSYSTPYKYNSSYEFYNLIISEYNNIMAGFEVDFMDYLYLYFNNLTNIIDTSNEWQKGMNNALLNYNLSNQYCMSLPNYILNSVKYNSVTNARASEDDFPGNPRRWKIAYSSLLLQSLDIKPFFDVIWTIARQPGNKYYVNRRNIELQAITAVLSNGPLGIGDNINKTNVTIINRLCNSNGLLLHPSVSITPIDSMYYRNNSITPIFGEIWYTYNIISNILVSYNIFSVNCNKTYYLTFLDLYPMPSNNNSNYIVYNFDVSKINNICLNNSYLCNNKLKIFNINNPLKILDNPRPKDNLENTKSFSLYSLNLVFNNGWTILGDLSIYVNLSHKRFIEIIELNNGLSVDVLGNKNENITITFVNPQYFIVLKYVTFSEDNQIVTVNVM